MSEVKGSPPSPDTRKGDAKRPLILFPAAHSFLRAAGQYAQT